MTRIYNLIGYAFVALLLLTFAGFYITYFGQFPEFKNLTITHHFHALVFLSWFALLITQPFLIRYRKFELHRRLGKVSYGLVPLVLFSIFMATKGQFERLAIEKVPLAQNLAGLFMPLLSLFLFGFFYLLAMLNRHNVANHMRYIIASSLVLIGPSLGRILIIWFGRSFPDAVWYGGFMVPDAIMLALLISDKLNRKASNAYAVSLVIALIFHVAWYVNFQETSVWQSIAGALF